MVAKWHGSYANGGHFNGTLAEVWEAAQHYVSHHVNRYYYGPFKYKWERIYGKEEWGEYDMYIGVMTDEQRAALESTRKADD